MIRSALLARAIGAVLAGWVPISVVASAVWRLRAQRDDSAIAHTALVAIAWPSYVLGHALLEYANSLTQPEHFDLGGLVSASMGLGAWSLPLLVVAGVGAALIRWQSGGKRRDRWWGVVSAATLVAGAAAFLSTRARAHDAREVAPLSVDVVFGDHIPVVSDLPSDATCRPPQEGAVRLPLRSTSDKQPWSNRAELLEWLESVVELNTQLNRVPTIVRVEAHPEFDPVPVFEALETLAVRHAELELEVERLYLRALPDLPSETLGRVIPRARLCVLPVERHRP